MILKNFLIASLLFLLPSCFGPKTIEIASKPEKITINQPSRPSPIALEDIHWRVVNKDQFIYYSLTEEDYKILNINMFEIRRYIVDQKNIIKYYENVTGDENNE